MKTKSTTLPETEVFTNRDDIKYLLFQQSEVISDFIRTNNYWFEDNLEQCFRILQNKIDPNNSEVQLTGNVVDIGCGFGSFSIPLAVNLNKNYNFICFEPINFLVKQFVTNTMLNCVDNITVHNVGLSNKNDTIDYPTMDPFLCGNHGSFSFADQYDEVRGICNTEYKINYELRTLDSYNLKEVKLIKISVNGYEKEVLEGARKTIQENNLPPLVIELWSNDFFIDKKFELETMLNDMGYKFFDKKEAHYFVYADQETASKLNSEINSIESDDLKELENLLADDSDFDSESKSDNTDFDVIEKSHNTEATIKNQTVYNQ